MSVYEVIHDWWGETVAITAVIPATQFVTGHVHDVEMPLPYATLVQDGGATMIRTNCGRVLKIASMRIQCWLENHATGVALQEVLKQTFEDQQHEIAGYKIERMRLNNELHFQEDDGVWQFLTDWQVIWKLS